MKAPYIRYSQPEANLAVMQQLKSLFDPKGLLNPYKVGGSLFKSATLTLVGSTSCLRRITTRRIQITRRMLFLKERLEAFLSIARPQGDAGHTNCCWNCALLLCFSILHGNSILDMAASISGLGSMKRNETTLGFKQRLSRFSRLSNVCTPVISICPTRSLPKLFASTAPSPSEARGYLQLVIKALWPLQAIMSIPTIDLRDFGDGTSERDQATARQLLEAYSALGFAYIVHGLLQVGHFRQGGPSHNCVGAHRRCIRPSATILCVARRGQG
jgi:hypothetical protein